MSRIPRIERVTSATRPEFVEYALAHGAEHDDSFANAEDLREFDPVFEPAAVARDGSGAVVGAASLMVRGYATTGVARFRVLHALEVAAYRELAEAVTSAAPRAVRETYLFVPDGAPVVAVLGELGFLPSRYSIVLERDDPAIPSPLGPPAAFTIAEARPGVDERAWVGVINSAFADFSGRYDMTEEQAVTRLADERILPGGALVAWHGSEAVGLTLVAQDEQDGREIASIDHLAVVPGAQGRGLGRALLRAAIRVAGAAGYSVIELSTGETNERALALYASEGFEVVQRVVCLARAVGG